MRAALVTPKTAAVSWSRSHPSCDSGGAVRHAQDGAEELETYSDKELEFLIRFLRGNVAYQEERMRRLEGLKARKAFDT